ncbi:hypothetical protein MPER_14997, partial [Moniliophthora perniciosa FA553]
MQCAHHTGNGLCKAPTSTRINTTTTIIMSDQL